MDMHPSQASRVKTRVNELGKRSSSGTIRGSPADKFKSVIGDKEHNESRPPSELNLMLKIRKQTSARALSRERNKGKVRQLVIIKAGAAAVMQRCTGQFWKTHSQSHSGSQNEGGGNRIPRQGGHTIA